MHAFLLLPKMLKQWYLSLSRFLRENKNNREPCPTGNHTLNHEDTCEQTLNHAFSPQNNTHKNGDQRVFNKPQQPDIEHINIDQENVSREVINDVICDNIILKNKLEKIASETTNLNQKVEEMGANVKALSDLCDILVVDILKDGKTNKTSKLKDTKPKRAMLYP